MDDGRIEKATRRARLVLSNGRVIRGEVFVGLYDAHHVGPQRVGELLNEDSAFIPVKTGKSVILIHRAHIVSVALPADREKDDLVTLGKRYTVRVKTTCGEFRGTVFVNLPDVSNRVRDYLNQPSRFFTLFQSKTVVYLNRNYIMLVED
jgi:hypothetical protein